MRIFTHLITLLIAVLLASCGGGGGSPGLAVSGPSPIFSVAAPAALTLAIGSSQQYTIHGGIKPYTVFSNNPAVVTGWLIGDSVVAIGAVSPGGTIVSVQDSAGQIFTTTVTSGTTLQFFTTMPAQLNLLPGPFGTQTYKVGGGIPPYKAVSGNPSVVSVVVNGTDVIVTALQTPSTASITLTDSSNPPGSFPISVSTGAIIPLTVTPSNTTLTVGTTLRAVITGGTPPYRFIVLDQCASNVSIVNGNILQATGNLNCTGSAITVLDANNTFFTMSLTISPGVLGLQVAPSALTVPENANTPNLSLLVYGVRGSSIQVFSTDTTLLAPQPPVKNADGTYTIALAGGNTCSLTVTPAQPAQATPFKPAVPGTGGDRTVTITIIDDLGEIGTSVLTVKDSNGIGGC